MTVLSRNRRHHAVRSHRRLRPPVPAGGQPPLRSMVVRRAKGQGRWAQEAGPLSPTALSVSLVADCILAGPGRAHRRDPWGRRPRRDRTGAGPTVGPVAVTGTNRRGYASRRSADAAVVVLEPEPSPC